ncbi:Imm74 family immunity protein [Methylocapsa palsarum]|uniref:Immunity protein 74 n=1 Tax=Methylocapsa palsarum TaxID=1612308 RepID=A0A1I3Z4G6_9HYPH|nr:Imm74 family immunity protein [Methylocapsa palsarum]SFK38900.1 Immunity protein 74 [Methylocapsa palsarum]
MTRRSSRPFLVTLTEGSIKVRSRDKVVTIFPAAAGMSEAEGADFVVDLDEILCWDAPHESVEIEVAELLEILKAIEDEFDRLGLVVEFS